tara:strand:- start:2557 stop:3144 length:588 start_codon:yes stop_codon:yes gene_type:complete
VNIFALDKDPVIAAKMSCDKHIVKMILESAQMLCTAKRVADGELYMAKTKNGRDIKRWRLPNSNEEAVIYKAGWLGHPSTKWVMESAYNYTWLYRHFKALNDEFMERFPKNKPLGHKSFQLLGDVLKEPPLNATLNKIATLPTPAMPEECKVFNKGVIDVVASYRKYYIMKKKDFARWSHPGKAPEWFTEGVANA